MAGFDGPIYLALGKSRRLAGALLAIHACALAAIAVTPGAWKYLFMLFVAANAVHLHYRGAAQHKTAITALLLDSHDGWSVTFGDGRVDRASLARPAFVSPALTSLSLRLSDGRVRHVALLRDNVAHDPYRRLRVRLRHRRAVA